MKNTLSRSAPVVSGCGVTSGLVSRRYGEGASHGQGLRLWTRKGVSMKEKGGQRHLKAPLFRIFGMASAILDTDISEPQGTPCRYPPPPKLSWWTLGAADRKDTGGWALLGYVLGFPRWTFCLLLTSI